MPTVREAFDARHDAELEESARLRRGAAMQRTRAAIDRIEPQVANSQKKLVDAAAYTAALQPETGEYAIRARRHFRNRLFMLIFFGLLPFVFLADAAFTFPPVANTLSGIALANFFPSLGTWQGQMRLCAIFAFAMLMASVALKLATETHGDIEDRLNAPLHGFEDVRLRRTIWIKSATRVLYLALMIAAAYYAWGDSVRRATLNALATGATPPATNHTVLMALGGSVCLHAILLWFPCHLLYHDPLASQFVCPPHLVGSFIKSATAQRQRGARLLRRIVSDAPEATRGEIAAEISPEIRRCCNEALGEAFFVEPAPPAAPPADVAAAVPHPQATAAGAPTEPAAPRGGFARVL